MTVQQLRPPVVTGMIAAARHLVADGAAVPVGSLSDAELVEAIAELASLESQIAAWRLDLAAETHRRRLADEAAETGTDALLARLTGERREVLNGGLLLAELLRTKYAATRVAFAAGRLRPDQVRVIVRAAEHAPKEVTSDQLRVAEEALVARATGEASPTGTPMNAGRLRQAARRMFETVSRELADRCEAAQLTTEERRAEGETWLSLHDQGDGTFAGRFVIPERHGHLLRSALQRLTSPRRLGRDRDGQQVEDHTLTGFGSMSWSEHNGAAFVELLEHLPTEGHGGNVASMLVTTSLDTLVHGVGAARLDTGVRISPSAARHLACGAEIIPIVLDGASVPLDLGRAKRLHTKAQRLALATVHESCAVAGCERPFAWCEIHHPHAWSKGGATDLANGLPLCGHHHRRAHDDRFDLRRHTTGDWRYHRRR